MFFRFKYEMKSDEKKLLFLSEAKRISVGGVPEFRALHV